MKKLVLIFSVALIVLFSAHSDAALVFKITSDDTTLTVGQIATVKILAWADSPLAVGQNGLNSWQLSALVDSTGVVEVVSGSIAFEGPSPWSPDYTKFTSINAPSTGMINYLRLSTEDVPQDSDAGIGDYTEIVSFNIKAIGEVGSSVTYTLGGDNFGGSLRDYVPSFDEASYILSGSFNANDSQRLFTIVPEPATLILLSGFGMAGFLTRRKK
jgi:hypothetical protein